MSRPLLAIKKKCLEDCCAGDYTEWKECPIKDCALFPYRLGHNEKRKGIGNHNAQAPKKT